jgi:hypothetical protein
MCFAVAAFVPGKRAFDTDPSGTVVRRNGLARSFCSINGHPKCTPPLKLAHVSVAAFLHADGSAYGKQQWRNGEP